MLKLACVCSSKSKLNQGAINIREKDVVVVNVTVKVDQPQSQTASWGDQCYVKNRKVSL